MPLDRRTFLKSGGLIAGGTAAAGVITRVVRAACCESGSSPAGPAFTALTVNGAACCGQSAQPPASGTGTVPVLTAEGKLVHVASDQIVHAKGRPPADPVVRQGVPGRKWIMVIDLAVCDGCGTCTRACSKMHFVPPDREWIPVMKMRETPETSPFFFPKPCFHCDNPPCTKVCPVGATFKRQDGVVLIDNERCIGCRFCMAACPYSTRHFNWGHPQEPPESRENGYSPENGHPRRVGTVEKCDFCPDMAEMGMLPACAASCPFGVIYYGDENEDAVTNGLGVTVRLSKLLEERAAYRYMEELGTHPRVYYLPPKNRKFPGPKLAPDLRKQGAASAPPQAAQSAGAGAADHTHAK